MEQLLSHSIVEEPIWAQNIVLFINVIKYKILKGAFYSVTSYWEAEITALFWIVALANRVYLK